MVALLFTLGACASSPSQKSATQNAPPAAKIRVERADQLPLHVYPIATTAMALFQDEAQFAALAQRLEADLRADLAAYTIEDRATLKSYYGTLSGLALKRGEYETAVAYQDSIRILEDKPGLKLLTGLVERGMAEAKRAPAERFETAFRESLRHQIAALPYQQVQAELASMKARLEILAPNIALGIVQTEIEPAASGGSISRELAQRLVAMRVLVDRIAPLREALIDELRQTIAAHAVEKPDIWAARAVSLEGRTGLTPVTVAIWDSGVDTNVFAGQVFTNAADVPGNNKDDDNNGYVDDVHGIAHDLESGRTIGVLLPLSLTPAEANEYRGYTKGILDLQAGLNTPEADAFKRKIASTAPADFKSLREKAGEYVFYAHGTHVAGIAVAENPAARVLVARFTSDEFKVPPTAPTIELARKAAQQTRENIDYFRQHGVRVVNMSWGLSPKFFEADLEANNIGATAEERRKLARQIFDIHAEALRAAMAGAPDILFVAAAGNEDADNTFSEFVPSAFDLPNLITAAAVDRAGDEAAFTSYGKVDVYANGYEVRSRVPGGEVIPLSGTSMAAPQVVNLAAKLLAVKPALTVAELRRAIIEASDEKTIGEGKRIRLLNPKASLERVAGH
jgi:hypothetical protein